ncbi:uncharacterized protein SPPG_01702 [Spizellomyces punctatus DAOM BR117]|uniref:DUF7330 domain-containing protein n=1 Tax=Spizellomyces punctatus (strain DAOM BR117) TaxID=645134 RepID=A0A0L0HNU9_SPIPD|nr:uncharacterized protein SPPG_01702 [Spizellomyces punctatus DAOM BR117]KND02615.1 hypothetical protein SPPG_01702 [Spizellomyces punctatus DAOM BR117]|eukprot:XP_016610654.1 hypothetical protein SPPG_01702 [Spizellomyces punctatus DAOM BR117]
MHSQQQQYLSEKDLLLPYAAQSPVPQERQRSSKFVKAGALLVVAAMAALLLNPLVTALQTVLKSSHRPMYCHQPPEFEYTPEPGIWHADPSKVQAIEVEGKGASSGGITLSTSSSITTITAEAHFRLASEELIRDIHVTAVTTSSGTFQFTVETPDRLDGRCILSDVRLTLPTSLSERLALKVKGRNAFIKVEDMGDVQFGGVELITVNGAIDIVKTINGADIGLQTTNGAIQGDVISKASFKGTTTNGGIKLSFPASDEHPKTISVHTTNGVAHVSLPDSFSGHFAASTKMGRVTVEGSDLHFDDSGRPGHFPGIGGRRTGWKGAENGEQKVEVGTVNGAARIIFV